MGYGPKIPIGFKLLRGGVKGPRVSRGWNETETKGLKEESSG